MPHQEPRRLSLANLPTPLRPSFDLSQQLGVELLIKRDDLSGFGLSGNKIRKLEYELAWALDNGISHVITCGKYTSNHCRATALACAPLDLECHLLLRLDDLATRPDLEGNYLLDLLAGAKVHFTDNAGWKKRDELMAGIAADLEAQGGKVMPIVVGASDPLGSWGYIQAVREIKEDLAGLNIDPAEPFSLVCAAGSGGTLAGLVMGVRLLGLEAKVVGINVDSAEFIQNSMLNIMAEAAPRYGLDIETGLGADVELVDGYVGPGYGKATDEQLAFCSRMTREHGLLLDPVYTGKAMWGMFQELEKNPERFGSRMIFIHTGGGFGLFPFGADLVRFC